MQYPFMLIFFLPFLLSISSEIVNKMINRANYMNRTNLCNRTDAFMNGNISLRQALSGLTLKVAIAPSDKMTVPMNGSLPSGFMADILQEVSNRAQRQLHSSE